MTNVEIAVEYGEYRWKVAHHFSIHPADVTAEDAARYDAHVKGLEQ